MTSDDLLQTIVLNFHTTLFLKEFEECIRINPQCSIGQFRADFINKHDILKRSQNSFSFTLYHQGVAISIAYSLFVLPFESDDDFKREIKKWNPEITALQYFTASEPTTTSEWLRHLRNAVAHGKIEITKPEAGKGHGEACFEFRDYNFTGTCSYSAFQEFLDEFCKTFLKWKNIKIDP